MLELTYYQRPHGTSIKVPLRTVSPEAENYFLELGATLSIEDDPITGGFILYADIGLKTEDGEPQEVIHVTRADAITAFDELMELCKQARGE